MNKIQLNPKQQSAYNNIIQFLNQSEHKHFYLLGYAGTGKTFLLASVITDLISKTNVEQVYICAPTHKALNVIESYFRSNVNTDNQKISFMTIQKLLEFRPIVMQTDGTKVFKSVRDSKFLRNLDNRLVIVDECSMIPSDMEKEMRRYSETYPLKFIFMGDSAQLPPVKESISKIFSRIPSKYPYHILLDDIMRTNSDVIKKISQIIREWDQSKSLIKTLLPMDGTDDRIDPFKFYKKSANIESSKWFKNFISFLKSKRHASILAWRNPTCHTYNNLVRKHLHSSESLSESELNTYIPGDHLMFFNFYKSGIDTSTFLTSDVVELVSSETKSMVLYDWGQMILSEPTNNAEKGINSLLKKLNELESEFQIITMMVHKINGGNLVVDSPPKIIQTIQLDNMSNYKNYIKIVKDEITNFSSKYNSEKYVSLLWDIYHRELIDKYADVNFSYSTTVHKAQGSTYEIVFVDVDDIIQNPDKSEVKKSIYTATTRTSEILRFLV